MNIDAGKIKIAKRVLAVLEMLLGVAGLVLGMLAFVAVADCPDTVPECEQFVRRGGRLFIVSGAVVMIAGVAAWYAKSRSILIEQIVLVVALAGLWLTFG